VAQTTVLIGVNPCLTGSYLKKQSQFAARLNWRKVLYERGLWSILRFEGCEKQTQFKANIPAFGRKY